MTLGGPSTSAGNRPGRRTHFSRCPRAQGRVPVGRWRPRRRGAGRQAWPRPQGGHWPALGQPAGPPCPAGLATQQDWTPGPRAAVLAPGPRGAYLTPSAGGALAGRVARRLRVPTATAERAPSRQERGRGPRAGPASLYPPAPDARPPGGAAAPRMGGWAAGGGGEGGRRGTREGGRRAGVGAGVGLSPGGAARLRRGSLSRSCPREVRVPPHAPTGLPGPAPHFQAASTRGQALGTQLRSKELLLAAKRAPTAQGDPSSVPRPAPPLSGPAQAQPGSAFSSRDPRLPCLGGAGCVSPGAPRALGVTVGGPARAAAWGAE